ncbi:BlaI/MecI/CopY family transcriptional regulator [Hymenobacter volaticus]|uniref:BlaI/MecI/CopY family transcriptional regulator n=1 Tax=Hymenobacter volaticus TaxID=2932254 RepID=A0ABY4G1B0_9BACT|nr:BlaI/MecI/CopY family transcriptional regulator [Hymenobacter volaticus]UOQ64649.1 BlaI/MecI/CopY family transcriptional regulator [Hymenobacter volaticus]
MEELTKTEERIMQILWKLKKAFVKDIIEQLPDEPKPPYNTISSVVRILERKEYVGFKAYGKTYEYFPLISRAQYRTASFKRLLTQYFDNSPSDLVSFMVEEEKLDQQQVQLLLLKLLQADQASKQDGDAQ